jgi:hypothetical protein
MASLLADVDALPAAQPKQPMLSVLISEEMRPMILAAARARRMSPAAYARRALYALACFDTGRDLHDVLARDPRITRENGSRALDPAGTIFGDWEIGSLISWKEPDDGA